MKHVHNGKFPLVLRMVIGRSFIFMPNFMQLKLLAVGWIAAVSFDGMP